MASASEHAQPPALNILTLTPTPLLHRPTKTLDMPSDMRRISSRSVALYPESRERPLHVPCGQL